MSLEQFNTNPESGSLGPKGCSLAHAEAGDILSVFTENGAYVIRKLEDGEGAMQGWEMRVEGSESVERVELEVLEPNQKGTSFLTGRTNIETGDEFGYVRVESDKPNIIVNLGEVVEAEFDGSGAPQLTEQQPTRTL